MWSHEECLMHHGVKGMKWGVRRYQNEDGTLTDAGKKRYLTDSGGLTKSGMKRLKKELKRSDKLKRRVDMAAQESDVEKYGNRAKTAGKVALGAGGVAAGALAIRGLTNLRVDNLASAKAGAHRKVLDDVDNRYLLSRKVVEAKKETDYLKNQLNDNSTMKKKLYDQSYDRLRSLSDARNAARDALEQDMRKSSDAKYRYEEAEGLLNKIDSPTKVVAALAGGVAVGAAGVAVYSKLRQKMAEKNIRDIQSGEAAKRYKEHTQQMINAFGSKTIRDARNFDKKKFNRDLDKLGAAENKVANLESIKNRVYKDDPKNGSYFYDKPIAEAKAARDAQYNKMASNAVARGKLENKYGYKDGLDTYYKKKKR